MNEIQNTKYEIQNSRGVALYLSLMIMSVLLALSLSISAIVLSQTKTLTEMGNSVFSFYAAETGIERALKEGGEPLGTLENGSSYVVSVIAPGADCPGQNLCIKSVGAYKATKRAIYIAR